MIPVLVDGVFTTDSVKLRKDGGPHLIIMEFVFGLATPMVRGGRVDSVDPLAKTADDLLARAFQAYKSNLIILLQQSFDVGKVERRNVARQCFVAFLQSLQSHFGEGCSWKGSGVFFGRSVIHMGATFLRKRLPTLSLSPLPQATPSPVFSFLNKVGSQRVPFHVPANGEKVFIPLNRKRFESSLIQ
jgi:hypothetical protein